MFWTGCGANMQCCRRDRKMLAVPASRPAALWLAPSARQLFADWLLSPPLTAGMPLGLSPALHTGGTARRQCANVTAAEACCLDRCWSVSGRGGSTAGVAAGAAELAMEVRCDLQEALQWWRRCRPRGRWRTRRLRCAFVALPLVHRAVGETCRPGPSAARPRVSTRW